MKATRQEPGFIPVMLTLETQHEVDAVYALFNHSVLNKAVDIPNAWQALLLFTRDSLHVKLCEAMEKYTKPASNSSKPASKPQSGVCETCPYSIKPVNAYPCNECMCTAQRGESKWKPKQPRPKRPRKPRIAKENRHCGNCCYERTLMDSLPCAICYGESKWKAR